jgi:hypothetical protein
MRATPHLNPALCNSSPPHLCHKVSQHILAQHAPHRTEGCQRSGQVLRVEEERGGYWHKVDTHHVRDDEQAVRGTCTRICTRRCKLTQLAVASVAARNTVLMVASPRRCKTKTCRCMRASLQESGQDCTLPRCTLLSCSVPPPHLVIKEWQLGVDLCHDAAHDVWLRLILEGGPAAQQARQVNSVQT